VRIAGAAPVTLVLGAGGGAMSPEAAAKTAELKKSFEEGVAASRAGNHDAAITAFEHAATLNEKCFDCYYNIAFSQAQKKDYDKAEAAYKKAIEIKPDYAEAYNGLANIYNAQRKFDEAATASAKAMELSGGAGAAAGAAGGGNADALFNQGVILWNAGKIADAKKQFEAAIAAKPDHAEAHYQLGMALVNEGNLAAAGTEFETYLKLAPTGPNAATAKNILSSLPKK
jgi:tetratricopeptide (TPR) repeat protein